VGLTLGVHAHAAGWPIPRGGSQQVIDAMSGWLRSRGVRFETGQTITDIHEIADSRTVFLDVTPRAASRILGPLLTSRQHARYQRFRYGPGVTKVDYTLDGPVPWVDPNLSEAGTIHIGGPAATVHASERAITRGGLSDEPFVMVSVPTMFDSSRAPAGKHVVWAYAHTPAGWDGDATELVTRRIESFAPGFRDLVRGSASTTAAGYANYNENYVRGDISAGETNLRQLLARPVLSLEPWRTPVAGVYMCSSSTAPGPGVHGMSGASAARVALKREYGLTASQIGVPRLTDLLPGTTDG
jgi:phytoene dehydrogenase-like protein